MPAMRIRRSATRLIGIAAIAAGLALSTTGAMAAPWEIGFYECGVGECGAIPYASAETNNRTPYAGDPLSPGFTP